MSQSAATFRGKAPGPLVTCSGLLLSRIAGASVPVGPFVLAVGICCVVAYQPVVFVIR